VAAQWDMTVNKQLPHEVRAGSSKKVGWVCDVDPTHTWPAAIKLRTGAATGCPRCFRPGESKAAFNLYWELKQVFPDVEREPLIQVQREVKPGGTRMRGVEQPDFGLPKLKVVIEYDGSLYHMDRIDKDKRKNRRLKSAGFRVLRLRESGLAPISDWTTWDIEVRPDATRKNPWRTACAIISRLQRMGFELPSCVGDFLAQGRSLVLNDARLEWKRLVQLRDGDAVEDGESRES